MKLRVDASGKEFTTNLIFFTELKRNGVTANMPQRDWYTPEVTPIALSDPAAGANVNSGRNRLGYVIFRRRARLQNHDVEVIMPVTAYQARPDEYPSSTY